MHATPKLSAATTVAIDLSKDVLELAFADAAQRVVERKRLHALRYPAHWTTRSSWYSAPVPERASR